MTEAYKIGGHEFGADNLCRNCGRRMADFYRHGGGCDATGPRQTTGKDGSTYDDATPEIYTDPIKFDAAGNPTHVETPDGRRVVSAGVGGWDETPVHPTPDLAEKIRELNSRLESPFVAYTDTPDTDFEPSPIKTLMDARMRAEHAAGAIPHGHEFDPATHQCVRCGRSERDEALSGATFCYALTNTPQ
jgi:hypothetical protein